MNANLKKLEKLQAEYAKNDKKMAALMERQQEIENSVRRWKIWRL